MLCPQRFLVWVCPQLPLPVSRICPDSLTTGSVPSRGWHHHDWLEEALQSILANPSPLLCLSPDAQKIPKVRRVPGVDLRLFSLGSGWCGGWLFVLSWFFTPSTHETMRFQ